MNIKCLSPMTESVIQTTSVVCLPAVAVQCSPGVVIKISVSDVSDKRSRLHHSKLIFCFRIPVIVFKYSSPISVKIYIVSFISLTESKSIFGNRNLKSCSNFMMSLKVFKVCIHGRFIKNVLFLNLNLKNVQTLSWTTSFVFKISPGIS